MRFRGARRSLVSIVRATANQAKALGLKKVGLFGTGFSVRARFYPDKFQRINVDLVVPKEAERDYIHSKYIGELLKNQFLPARERKFCASPNG